jgi:citrate lyase subunit beta / citryl-CoA lyase
VAAPRRRSCLSVPASSARKLEKAPALGADEVIIDLEDSVAIDAKAQALASTIDALNAWSGGPVSVRINAPRTPWCHVELVSLASLIELPISVVVPKLESADDIAFLDRLLDGAEAAAGCSHPVGIQALIETAAGLNRVDEIAAASVRLQGLILGYADLGASLGRSDSGSADLDLWLAVQERLLTAARTNNLQAIDGPYLGTAADSGFHASARRARDLGFDGKWAIHPSQVAALNALFTPTDAEIQHAQAVVAALTRSESEHGAGAVELDGVMLDEAVRKAALRVLARSGATNA